MGVASNHIQSILSSSFQAMAVLDLKWRAPGEMRRCVRAGPSPHLKDMAAVAWGYDPAKARGHVDEHEAKGMKLISLSKKELVWFYHPLDFATSKVRRAVEMKRTSHESSKSTEALMQLWKIKTSVQTLNSRVCRFQHQRRSWICMPTILNRAVPNTSENPLQSL